MSHVGAPEEYLLVFKVDGEMFPGGGIIKKVLEAELTVAGATKVFLYVDNIESAIEVSLIQFLVHSWPWAKLRGEISELRPVAERRPVRRKPRMTRLSTSTSRTQRATFRPFTHTTNRHLRK